MQQFKADLHIHSVLSPCADLDMSPENIIQKAKEQGLQIIAVTDHNSTRNCCAIIELAKENDIICIPACEINTMEEIHILCYFKEIDKMNIFQEFIDQHLPKIKNDPNYFGDQVITDKEANILGYEEFYLGSALNVSIEVVEQKVHELEGIFIPAHIDRPVNSIYSQLGFIPDDLKYEALQITKKANEKYVRNRYNIKQEDILVRFSDAHYTENIGEAYTIFEMEEARFEELQLTFKKLGQRKVFIN